MVWYRSKCNLPNSCEYTCRVPVLYQNPGQHQHQLFCFIFCRIRGTTVWIFALLTLVLSMFIIRRHQNNIVNRLCCEEGMGEWGALWTQGCWSSPLEGLTNCIGTCWREQFRPVAWLLTGYCILRWHLHGSQHQMQKSRQRRNPLNMYPSTAEHWLGIGQWSLAVCGWSW